MAPAGEAAARDVPTLSGYVDLQGHAVKRERDRLVGLGAVQVVD